MLSFLRVSISLALLAVSVAAQDAPGNPSAVPPCALSCTIGELPNSPCAAYGISNLTCICDNSAFQSAFYACSVANCSSTDLGAAIAYGVKICQDNGTPIANSSATPTAVTAVSPSTTGGASTSSSAKVSTSPPSSASPASTPAASSTSAGMRNLAGAGALALALVGGVVLLL